jgi:hypothetical protein
MPERTGRFRVYRVVEAVPHINLVDVGASTLYTVFQSGYPDDRQAAVDDLRTGDLIEATLSGAPDRDDEPWRLETLDRIGGVEMGFVVDVEPPRVATDLWEDGLDRPAGAPLEETPEDGPVAELYVQPRDPLPRGAFAPTRPGRPTTRTPSASRSCSARGPIGSRPRSATGTTSPPARTPAPTSIRTDTRGETIRNPDGARRKGPVWGCGTGWDGTDSSGITRRRGPTPAGSRGVGSRRPRRRSAVGDTSGRASKNVIFRK